jgi:hypothetical protein
MTDEALSLLELLLALVSSPGNSAPAVEQYGKNQIITILLNPLPVFHPNFE